MTTTTLHFAIVTEDGLEDESGNASPEQLSKLLKRTTDLQGRALYAYVQTASDDGDNLGNGYELVQALDPLAGEWLLKEQA